MEFLKGLALNWHLVIPVLIAFNLLMTGIHGALDKIKGLTASDGDDKADNIVVTMISWVQKVIDILTANKEH